MKNNNLNYLEYALAVQAASARYTFVRRLTLFLSMLISGGMLLLPRIPLLLAVILLGLMATKFRVAPWRQTWLILIVMIAVLLLTVVRPGPIHIESLMIRYANFICAFVLLNIYLLCGMKIFSSDLYAILRWMALQAIATAILANLVPTIFTTVGTDDESFQSVLLIFNYHTLFEDAIFRPDGFFYEPGVYQIYLNIYLYLAIFVFKNNRQGFLATIAVFVTQSTTGVFIAVILLSAAFSKRTVTGNLRNKIITLFVTLLVAPPIAYIGYNNVTDKLTGASQGSSWSRKYDFFTGLNVIAEYPLLGIGFDHQRYLSVADRVGYADTLLDAESLYDRPTSNGLVFLFYSLGIPFAFVFLIGLFRQTFFEHRTLIGLLFAVSMLTESIIFTPFIMMVIFSSLVFPRIAVAEFRGTKVT